MIKYKKYKNKLEIFLSSNKGRRILNLFYSWGAACVILGALMEILKVKYGDIVLAVSMLVEFAVFFISGFEKPQQTYNWEEVFPELDYKKNQDKKDIVNLSQRINKNLEIINEHNTNNNHINSNVTKNDIEKLITAINDLRKYTCHLSKITSDKYENNTKSLEYNISTLNHKYELKLKCIGSQIEILDKINTDLKYIKTQYEDAIEYSHTFRKQNELMTLQLKQLNSVYSRLLDALTVNMNGNKGSNI